MVLAQRQLDLDSQRVAIERLATTADLIGVFPAAGKLTAKDLGLNMAGTLPGGVSGPVDTTTAGAKQAIEIFKTLGIALTTQQLRDLALNNAIDVAAMPTLASRQFQLQAKTATEEIASMAQQCATGASEMAQGTSKVTEAILQVSATSEQTSASAEEVSASTEELSAQSEELAATANQMKQPASSLNDAVSRFQTETTGA